ncbi:MAG TPA: universal stress protein [Syntrophobacteraceae bacterium]|jgi:nucleotide-binding universal stress UspA family protein|nr:universal stress protein [Syntrophobacteraceae bacterium]HBD06779.1 universal stress protein [Syntrophobacteraceae bacterium]HBZ55593.1 universal stress protein [Syntrophobacteraceae bacterium]
MEENLVKNIVFCTDFSPNADHAFLMAKDLAWRYGATLHIVHVMVTFSFSPIGEVHVPIEYDAKFVERATDAATSTIQERYVSQLKQKQPYEITILSGYPATEVVELAKEKNIDLIIMGCHGLTGIAHVLFGSTADRVVRKAPCSVLTVRLGKH